jgi:hypothetical protein
MPLAFGLWGKDQFWKIICLNKRIWAFFQHSSRHVLVRKLHSDSIFNIQQLADAMEAKSDVTTILILSSVTASSRFVSSMSNNLLRCVCKAMERIAPIRLAEKWDNVRLQLNRWNTNLHWVSLGRAIARCDLKTRYGQLFDWPQY